MGSWLDRFLGRDGEKSEASPARVSNPSVPKPPPELLGRAAILEGLGLGEPGPLPAEPDGALVTRLMNLFRETSPVPGSPPQLAMRILNLVAQSDVDPAELAKLISLEPALTAAVLRVANSAAYRSFGRIASVRDAITRLGMREVARVGCALSAKSVFDPQRRNEQALYGPVFLDLFIHASTTALAAASLALSLPRLNGRSDLIFLGGLLHDLGKSVGLRLLATIVGAEPTKRPLTPDEVHALLDHVHVDIGVELHREWQLPAAALEICLAHHQPRAPDSEYFIETHAVRLTSAMHLLRARPVTEARLLEVEESACILGLSKFQLRSFDADIVRFREMSYELGS